ncbi:MAG TPA: hypothetical protein VGC34_17800, partial [Steroidobacteraceae bacterium]
MTSLHHRLRGALWCLAAVFGAAMLPSFATAATDSEGGKALLSALCTQCHGLPPITSVRNGAAGWRTTVYKMVQNGAQIRTQAELDAIVNYLAETYGPAAGAMVTGVLPPGAALGHG